MTSEAGASKSPVAPVAPVAQHRPFTRSLHGEDRVDEYAWLSDRADPEVLAYLEAENAYATAATAHTEELRSQIFDEIAGRIQQTDETAPARKGKWWYSRRTIEGSEYPIYIRRADSPDGPEETLLDENILAEPTGYVSLGAFALDRQQRLLAYSVDVDGGERFELRVRDLVTGNELPDVIPGTYYGVEWAADSHSLFYVMPDEMMRPWRLLHHVLGTPVTDDKVVYQEDDERFFLGLHLTRSEEMLLITLDSKTTSEVRFLRADDPAGELRVVRPRKPDVEYHVDHHVNQHGSRFIILTNLDAENFRLMEAPVADPSAWSELIPHRDDVRLEDAEAFAHHLVLVERVDARTQLRVSDAGSDADAGGDHIIDLPEEVSTVGVGANMEYDTTTLRFGYQSLVSPRSDYDYDMTARTLQLVKRDAVLGGYDPEQYETHRLWASASDGARIPISVVHRRGMNLDGTSPAVLYGYGAYEASIDPAFSFARVSLLERGFVFAIAHIRGGGEMGRRWYNDGKLAHKSNTFTDFIACAEHLIAQGYTSPSRLAIRGASAGGLLIGASINLRPDLFAVAVAQVPFVDVLTTMLDETLPLTVTEWEEWGDPRDPAAYAWIRAYSPYDNVGTDVYPAMYVTGGINDPRVSYWEPAKLVAKLRALRAANPRPEDRPLVLVTELGAGHFGPAGRYEAWRKEAEVLAFIIDNTAPNC